MKPRLRYIGLLFRPSTLSLTITLIITEVFAGLCFWANGLRTGAWYNYWFGSGGALTALQEQNNLIGTLKHTIFSNPTFNKVLYYVMWLVLGLLVYEIVMAIRSMVGSTTQAVEEEHYVHASPQTVWRKFGSRIVIRLVILGCWLLYSVFFLKLLLPFSLLSFKIWVGQLGMWTAWLYAILGTVVLFLSLHLHTVFLRLFMLRVRISDTANEALLDL